MAANLQVSVSVQNAILDAIEVTIGTTPILNVYSGTPPVTCATALSGNTKLAAITLPSDWMGNAASNSKAKSGTWTDSSADATGTAAFFRVNESTDTTTHIQGTCGTSSADMILPTVSVVATQPFTVNTFTLAAANS